MSTRQVTQLLTITNEQEGAKPLAIRVKVSYVVNGQTVSQVATCNDMP
jgi:hypothetical protein